MISLLSLRNNSMSRSLLFFWSFDRYISKRSDFISESVVSCSTGSAVFIIIHDMSVAPLAISCSFISFFLSGLMSSEMAILILLCSMSSVVRLFMSASSTLQYCAGGVSCGKNLFPAFHMLINLCSSVSVSRT